MSRRTGNNDERLANRLAYRLLRWARLAVPGFCRHEDDRDLIRRDRLRL